MKYNNLHSASTDIEWYARLALKCERYGMRRNEKGHYSFGDLINSDYIDSNPFLAMIVVLSVSTCCLDENDSAAIKANEFINDYQNFVNLSGQQLFDEHYTEFETAIGRFASICNII